MMQRIRRCRTLPALLWWQRLVARRSLKLVLLAASLASGALVSAVAQASEAGAADAAAAMAAAEPAPAVDPARAQLIERLLGLGVFQAHFAQYVEGARGEVIEESTGEVLLRRPQLRWEVDAPYPQVIVADESKLRIYDPDLAQVLIKPMSEALRDTPVALLTQESLSLSERYAVVHLPAGSDAEEEVFLVTPQDADSLFQEVRLHFLEGSLSQMLIFDQLGQYTTLKFKRIERSGVLDSAVFTLDLPEDVDVIEG